ncbi:MAG: A/G-specific adenine glycosylase [Pseudomonadota bacterium]
MPANSTQPRADDLLGWYDRHARVLPWRVPPAASRGGARPDPYHVWLSEVMLQQTTVAAVIPYFRTFTERWPGVADLAAAEDAAVMAAWAGLGYYARARNLLKCAREVTQTHGGVFPTTEAGLAALPGIGPYTAAAIAAIAFGAPAVVVDGNVERVIARVFDLHQPLPAAKPRIKQNAATLTPRARPGDYAQAVMDLGATICTPRNPACGLCPWRDPCAGRRAGTAEALPRKLPKAPKPVRHGTVFLALRGDGAALVETRPGKGLLGGMLGLPGNTWAETPPPAAPPLPGDWRAAGEVRHTFTHFHLILQVRVAVGVTAPAPPGLRFQTVLDRDLPTVMRKAYRLGRGALAA